MAREHRGRRRARWLIAAAALSEMVPLWQRGYGLGGTVVVRCREDHFFSTRWVPAASVKALRLGPWRVQRCPVGHHWTIVTPVDRAHLSADQLARAQTVHDVRVP